MPADRPRKTFDAIYTTGLILIAALAVACVFLPLEVGPLVTGMGSVLALLVVAAWIDKIQDGRRHKGAARARAEKQDDNTEEN
jgi:hypothetical protein